MGRRVLGALTVALVLVTGGCGDAAQPRDARYETVAELRDAVIAAGYPCPNWRLATDEVKPWTEAGYCSDADIFMVFATEADTQKAAGRILSNKTLLGPNWMVSTSHLEALPTLQQELGGIIY